MLKAVYGTAEFDHNLYLFERFKENINAGIKSYILVPEQFSVFTERNVIKKLGARSQSMIEVLTFSRLCNLVLGELGPLRLKYIDGAGKEILASRSMQLIESKLEYFRPNVRQKGFSSLLVGLVSEFKRYGHSPEELRIASEKLENDELSRKLADLSLFYKTYNSLINQSSSDAEDNLAIILPKLKYFHMPQNACLFISEFKSFTPLEYDALSELMKKLDEVSIILCCDDINNPSDPFRTSAGAYKTLCEAAHNAGIPTDAPKPLTLPKQRPWDLDHTLKNYFRIRPEKSDKAPEHIHFRSPATYYDEIEDAALIIHKLCRTKGYKQSDFLILARDTETYSGIMPLVFESCGINVFLDKRRSITENPYLRCLTSMLEILAYGFSYERVLNMARSGFCSGISDKDADIFDNYILSVNPSHAMWNDENNWSFNPNKHTYDMDMINSIKNKLLKPIFDLKSGLKGRKTAEEITDAIFGYMDICGHADIMKDLCRKYSENSLIYLAEEYRITWNSVVSVLTELGEIMSDTYISYERFYELFISACRSIKVGVSPQTIDGVVFSKIDLFRNTGAKVVIVLGVTDGVFPKGYGSEGLITDSERELLRSCGITLAQTAEEKSFDENILIYNVLSSCSKELYLLSPKSSGSDEELHPSKIVTRLKNELFANASDEEPPLIECREFALRDLMSKLAECDGDFDSLSGKYRELYDFFKESTRLSKFCERLKSAESGSEKLSKNMVSKLYGSDVMLSVSKLEKFNACAFSYFLRYGLTAKPRDIAVFDPLHMGNILHEAMERYFSEKTADTDYNKITKEQCRYDMNLIVSEIAKGADEVMYQNSAYYKYLVMRMSGIASTTAWETIKFFRISDFRPYGFEIRIGKDGTIPPIKIETKYGNASIEGFVDRADSAVIDGKRYISIVDYKSSSRALDKELAEAGVRFQPLVYANAICRSEENKPAAMLYQQMNDPIISYDNAKTEEALENEVSKNVQAQGWVVDDPCAIDAFDKNHGTKKCYISPRNTVSSAEMRERLLSAEHKIVESAEGILSGEISIKPYINRKFNPCDYCDYSSICRQTTK